MKTLDGLQDALDVVGYVWDGADVINMVISFCRGEEHRGEALIYLVCAIPVFGSFLGKGWRWLKSAGMDMVAKGIKKGDDLVSSLGVTYRVTADKVADTQKYLDDVFEQMAARRAGNGQTRFCFPSGYLDDSSRLMYEIHDDAGNTLSRISRMDEIADPKVLKELGGTGHLDDADDILSAAKGLDGTGGGGRAGAGALAEGNLGSNVNSKPRISDENKAKWGQGTFDSVEDSLEYHFAEHGEEVGAVDIDQYIRKAEGFSQNLKGAKKSYPSDGTPGAVRYTKNGKFIIIGPDGKILSFGLHND